MAVGHAYQPGSDAEKSLDAATSGTGTVKALNHCRMVEWRTDYSGTVSGGTIIIEYAHAADYPQTWSQLASIAAANVAAGTDGFGVTDGLRPFVRARISAAITGGGNVTVRLNGVLD